MSCGYNVNKRKHELSKIQRKERNFINRLKYAEVKIFSICVDVFKIYEGDDFSETYKVLSTLKNKELKINNILIEINKDMLKNPIIEQDFWSRTATGIYKIGHDSIRLMKCICYYDRSYYENIKFQPNKVSNYKQYFNELNINGFDFSYGFKCSDVHRFNELNNLSINKFELNFYQDQNK